MQFVYGFLTSIGFSILFNVPKNLIIKAGICGSVGWVGYLLMMQLYASPIAATFIASIIIGILSETLAKKTKNPATIFIIPAIVSLVPGATSYKTIYALIEGDNEKALSLAILTIGIALAISSGLIFVLSFFRLKRQRI